MKPIDLTGKKYGRLSVITRAENTQDGKARWLCKCECGNQVTVNSSSLRSGNTKSCGCLSREKTAAKNFKHGHRFDKLYGVWCGMKQRCYYKAHKSYHEYGGRGIYVCDSWKDSFEAFRAWAIQNGYQSDLSLERVDFNDGYTPENCCWVSIKSQANNRRNNHLISFKGQTRTLSEWSEITGINDSTIRLRLKSGWSIERALTEGVVRNEISS